MLSWSLLTMENHCLDNNSPVDNNFLLWHPFTDSITAHWFDINRRDFNWLSWTLKRVFYTSWCLVSFRLTTVIAKLLHSFAYRIDVLPVEPTSHDFCCLMSFNDVGRASELGLSRPWGAPRCIYSYHIFTIELESLYVLFTSFFYIGVYVVIPQNCFVFVRSSWITVIC